MAVTPPVTNTLGGAGLSGTPPPGSYNPDMKGAGGYIFGMGPQQEIDTTKIATGDPYMQKMQDAYYQQGAARLDPRFEASGAALDARLANQGLTSGSEAWRNSMQAQAFEKNDAYNQLNREAILNSGAEAQRLQGMDIASQKTQNEAYGQQFQQNLGQANLNNSAYGQLQGNILTREGFRSQESIAAANAQAAKDVAQMNITSNQEMQARSLTQQASQFTQSYALQTAAQQAQMDQFAETMGMTGRQLDAQIAQYSEANNISREQIANQLAIAQINAAAQRAASASSAAAARAGASASRANAQDSLAFQREQWAAAVARQNQFDQYGLIEARNRATGPAPP